MYQSRVTSSLACIHGQVTKHTTVKWPIAACSSFFLQYTRSPVIKVLGTVRRGKATLFRVVNIGSLVVAQSPKPGAYDKSTH